MIAFNDTSIRQPMNARPIREGVRRPRPGATDRVSRQASNAMQLNLPCETGNLDWRSRKLLPYRIWPVLGGHGGLVCYGQSLNFGHALSPLFASAVRETDSKLGSAQLSTALLSRLVGACNARACTAEGREPNCRYYDVVISSYVIRSDPESKQVCHGWTCVVVRVSIRGRGFQTGGPR